RGDATEPHPDLPEIEGIVHPLDRQRFPLEACFGPPDRTRTWTAVLDSSPAAGLPEPHPSLADPRPGRADEPHQGVSRQASWCGLRRFALVCERCFLPWRRRSFAPFDGLVFRRVASTWRAWLSRATRRSSARARFRSWLR